MEELQTNQPQISQADTATPGVSQKQSKWFLKGLVVVIVLIVAVSTVLVVKNSKQTSATPIASVQITGNTFSPSTIRIKKNQSVTWTNGDTVAHQIASDPYPSHASLPTLDSAVLNQNDAYTFTFEHTGTFTYHDALNPVAFRGTIIVE
jgi:plastocyanin